MMRLWTIAANAFVETIRQPLYLIVLLVTFGMLALSVPLSEWAMDSNADYYSSSNRMLVDLGLSTLLTSGLFIAAFSASGVLSREIEDRTVLTVVSKPVPRPVILVGKFLGVAAAVTAAMYVTSLVFLMTVRHGTMPTAADTFDTVVISMFGVALLLTVLGAAFANYLFGWNFTGTTVLLSLVLMTLAMLVISVVGKGWVLVPFGRRINPQILLVLAQLWMASILLAALAVTVSTRLGQAATLAVCVGFFFLSMAVEGLFLRASEHNVFARLLAVALPNLTYFFTLDALTTGKAIPLHHVVLTAGYAGLYTAALLALGVALFQTREMDARESASGAPAMVNSLAWGLRVLAVVALVIGLATLGARPSELAGLVVPVAQVLGAVLLWLLAGYLGSGVRWAWYALMSLTLVQLVLSVLYLGFLRPALLTPEYRAAALALSVGLAFYVLVMSVRRSTREHFVARRHQPLPAA